MASSGSNGSPDVNDFSDEFMRAFLNEPPSTPVLSLVPNVSPGSNDSDEFLRAFMNESPIVTMRSTSVTLSVPLVSTPDIVVSRTSQSHQPFTPDAYAESPSKPPHSRANDILLSAIRFEERTEMFANVLNVTPHALSTTTLNACEKRITMMFTLDEFKLWFGEGQLHDLAHYYLSYKGAYKSNVYNPLVDLYAHSDTNDPSVQHTMMQFIHDGRSAIETFITCCKFGLIALEENIGSNFVELAHAQNTMRRVAGLYEGAIALIPSIFEIERKCGVRQ